MNQITDLEDWKFFPRKILKEKLKNNLKEKLKSLEVPKKEKFQLLEKQNPEETLKKPRKHSLRKLSLLDSILSKYLSFLLFTILKKINNHLQIVIIYIFVILYKFNFIYDTLDLLFILNIIFH